MCINNIISMFKAIKMSTVIKSLFIPFVDISYDAEYIMDVLYCNDIAIVNKVTLSSVVKNSCVFNRAYIDIAEWLPSETAYNFIQRLKDPSREARIIHCDDNWWSFEVNKKPFINEDKKTNNSTTTINYLLDKVEFTCLPWLLGGVSDEENEWNCIEKDLSKVLAYQNLECQVCY